MATTAFVYHPDYLLHDTGRHPEQPARVAVIAEAVANASLPNVSLVTPAPASIDQILLVHTSQHVEHIRRLDDGGGVYIHPDTPVSPASYDVALLAAGGAIRAVQAVLTGEATNSFAAVRPPGHHATPDTAMGFCLFNNVAIAVRHAQVAFGLERVLIVDFDVHHGNGTQAIFEEDPAVLYVSLHEYPLYPGTGLADEVGQGPGRGYTINIPLPAGVGDSGYERVFDEVVRPVAQRFWPQLIVASAGYDAHWLDPLGGMALSTAGFATLAARLKRWAEDLCQGRLALVLEGGYDLDALAASALTSIAVLSGTTPVDPIGPAPNAAFPDVGPAIVRARRAHPEWFAAGYGHV